jgi:hypothetical protein
MPKYDTGFKIIAKAAGRRLAQIRGYTCQRWTPVVSEIQTAERFADRAFRARSGKERFVVYFEGYTTWKKDVPWSVLVKSALLAQRERLPVLSLVLFLRPDRYRPAGGTFQLAVQGGPTQQVWFEEICLWKEEPAEWWDKEPGLMALYPLCRHRRSPMDAVAHAADAIGRTEGDLITRADLLTTLGIFGKLAYPQINVLGIIGREQMRESKFYQELKQEGWEEGRLVTLREDAREALEGRFGPVVGAEFEPILSKMTSPDELKRLHALAVRSKGLAEFRRRLREH